jgi:predicted MFS family arabinose efflux permease
MREPSSSLPHKGRGGQKVRDWPVLLVLAGVQLGHILDFAILLPLGPRYQAEMDLSPAKFGLLVSAYAFAACLSGLLAATCIDRFDRKRALLLLQSGFLIATLLCGLAPSFAVLLMGRCLAGLFGGVLGAVVFAILGDLIPEERRGWATGVVLSASAVATVAGVPLGLTLAQALATGSPFIALAAYSAGVLLLAACLLPSSPSCSGVARVIATWRLHLQPIFLRAHVLMVVVVLGSFTLVPYLPTYLVANVGWQESELRWLYLCSGLATLVTNPLLGRLADRVGGLAVFRALVLLTITPILLVTNWGPAPVWLTLVLTTALLVCTGGRMVPAVALITSCAPPAIRGSFLSVNASVQQLAMGLAALLAGALLRQPGPGLSLEHYPLVGLLACAMAVLAVCLAGTTRPGQVPSGIPLHKASKLRYFPVDTLVGGADVPAGLRVEADGVGVALARAGDDVPQRTQAFDRGGVFAGALEVSGIREPGVV